jgi:hypothetical protein
MKKYVQLKDGVAFSTVKTMNEIETNENIIEVQDENVDSLLNKKFENGSFVTISKTKYAVIQNNFVYEIKETYFSSEVSGPLVSNDQIDVGWYFDGTNFSEKSPEQIAAEEEAAAAAATEE